MTFLGIRPLWWGLGAVALAGTYYALRDPLAECIDPDLDPELESLARNLLAPEKGDEVLGDLITRTAFMRRSSEIAARQGHPLLADCLLQRAEELENTIRDAGGVPLLPSELGKERAAVAAASMGSKGAGKSGKAQAVVQARANKASSTAKGSAPPGSSFLGLPDRPGPDRDEQIRSLVRTNLRPFAWMPVDCSRDGINCTVFVSDDALALADTEGNFVRFNVRHPTAEQIAKELNAFLPTSRISDLAYAQAHVKLTPHPIPAGPDMALTQTMMKHSALVEKERAGRTGLVRDSGKIWALTNKLVGRPERSSNFGWHGGPLAQSKSPGGAAVIEPLDLAHGAGHTDYSQIVQLVAPLAIVDGKQMPLDDLLRHPTLSRAVSDEGPLQIVRHPAVESSLPVA